MGPTTYRYFPLTNHFTKSFVGGNFETVGLNCAMDQSQVLHHEDFGYP
jgi:hypothetical protein